MEIPTLEILTGILVLITAFYAWATFRILKANERTVAVMKEQTELLNRPYINIRTYTVPASPSLYLEIKNIGKTAAKDLKLNIDRDFYQFGSKDENSSLAKLSAFQKKIDTFAPDSELTFHLGTAFSIFGEEANEQTKPKEFIITSSFKYGDKTVIEQTTIDLQKHLASSVPPDPVVKELGDIKKSIDKLSRSLGKFR